MSLALHASNESSPWRRALLTLVMAELVLLVMYHDTAAAMVGIWARSETFTHAFLVPPVALWLIWRQRRALAALDPKPSPWVLAPMAAVACIWLLGDLVSVNAVTQLALVALLVLAVPAILGTTVARAIAFPLTFLFFAVPLGEFLLPQLMSWTADFTVLALQASGIPVYREGNQFAIPSGNWSVVEACSGVRYLIASFMAGTLFAYLSYRSTRRRWIFVAISLAVPIVANWVRAYLIVLLGHVSGNRLAVGVDHLIYGWMFFALIIGIMFAIGTMWAEPDAQGNLSPGPRQRSSPFARSQAGASLWATAAAVALVGALPLLLLSRFVAADDAPPPHLVQPVQLSGGWQAADAPATDWKPAFTNPSAELASTYASQGRKVGVYIGYYRGQGYRRKLVSSKNALVSSTDAEWLTIATGDGQALQTPAGSLDVRTVWLRRVSKPGRPEQRLLTWQVYWVGDKLTSSDQWAKAYGAYDRLFKGSDDAAVIILYAIDEPLGSAGKSLDAFARANLDGVVAQLRKNRDEGKASIAANTYESPLETRK